MKAQIWYACKCFPNLLSDGQIARNVARMNHMHAVSENIFHMIFDPRFLPMLSSFLKYLDGNGFGNDSVEKGLNNLHFILLFLGKTISVIFDEILTFERIAYKSEIRLDTLHKTYFPQQM